MLTAILPMLTLATSEAMTKTKTTLKELIAQSNIPESLIRAVVRQSGGWESFSESAPDICWSGIDGGFHGFIYTRETVAFSLHNLEAIREMAKQQADDFGAGVIAMIQGFGCFRHDPQSEEDVAGALYGSHNINRAIESHSTVLNALAWYAGEEVAREYCRATGQD
jgi:hypothetical protein